MSHPLKLVMILLLNLVGYLTIFVVPASAAELPCQWVQEPQVVQQGQHELHQIWSFTDTAVFWSTTLPSSPSLEAFRQDVQAMIPNVEPQQYVQTHPPLPDGEAHNKIMATSGRAGQLQTINCLEALLLSEQTKRLPMLKQPSEFGAFILRKLNTKDSYEYKVFFSTQDQPGLKMNAKMMSLIDAERQSGWSVWAHLHNHNFFPANQDPFAYPSPSKTDIEFARMMHTSLNLENLWVTNGFHTLHLTHQAFDLFHGHSDQALEN